MTRASFSVIYFNRRMAALLGLGFASGLPYLLTLDSLSAWMTQAHVDIKTIGLFSLVTLPYALKFLWAPLMDRYVPPLLGRRRGWLVLMQMALLISILTMAWIGPAHLQALAAAALVVAFFSASQDIVADAYRTDVLPRQELGAGAAVFVMGYRLALITSGAGVLMLADTLGWRGSFIAMGLLMGACTLITLFAPEADSQVLAPLSMREAIGRPLAVFVQGKSPWRVAAMVAFILLFRLPDTLAGRMTLPFLLGGMHYAPADVGFLRQFAGLWVTIAGTLAGGLIVARAGVTRSLWLFGILQAVSNGGFLALAYLGPDASLYNAQSIMQLGWGSLPYQALAGVVVIESFCGGLVVAGFMAFLMSQCDKRYSATQYALLTSLMAITGSVLAAYTGYVVQATGYATFFALTILAGLPGMALIALLPPAAKREEEEVMA